MAIAGGSDFWAIKHDTGHQVVAELIIKPSPPIEDGFWTAAGLLFL